MKIQRSLRPQRVHRPGQPQHGRAKGGGKQRVEAPRAHRHQADHLRIAGQAHHGQPQHGRAERERGAAPVLRGGVDAGEHKPHHKQCAHRALHRHRQWRGGRAAVVGVVQR